MQKIHTTFVFVSNLDDTLLPNGTLTAAPGCLDRTRELLEQFKAANYPVIYIADRYLSLARESQNLFKLPDPDYWICNLGTEIYNTAGCPDEDWQRAMGPTLSKKALLNVLKGNPNLKALEDEEQGPHKFSFYYAAPVDDTLRAWMLDEAATRQKRTSTIQ